MKGKIRKSLYLKIGFFTSILNNHFMPTHIIGNVIGIFTKFGQNNYFHI